MSDTNEDNAATAMMAKSKSREVQIEAMQAAAATEATNRAEQPDA